MRKWIIGLSTSLVLMAGPAVALAATPVHVSITESFNITQAACNGDVIDLSGTYHASGNLVFSPNGSEHLVATANYSDVKGTDQVTGTKYVAVGAGQEQENATVNATGEATLRERVQLISQGSAQNLTATVYEHVTINANGTVTVDHTSATVSCSA